ncbi:MAG: low specificity L-threonine aldolase [Pseudomonadota bacterium]
MLFTSDNWGGVHPKILEAVVAAGDGFAPAYGNDPRTEHVRQRFAEVFECEVALAFVPTGSAANGIALSMLTPPYGAVVCHEHAHVLIDECGAPEFYTGGAKLLPAAGPFGKITPESLRAAMAPYVPLVAHRVKPSVLSLTQATEWGTVYTADEISELTECARGFGLSAHMDGARFAGAVNATGATPAELTWKAGVDILSLGATKNGCLAAEAVVLFDKSRSEELTYRCKRAGLGTSKQRFFSAQWGPYFDGDLWLELATQAADACQSLARVLARDATISVLTEPQINELFVRMPTETAERLRDAGAQFYDWVQPNDTFAGEARRFVTSWETTEDQIQALADVL